MPVGLTTLRKQAEELSGVPYSAVEVAKAADLYSRIGESTIRALSTAFYDGVYGDETGFRDIFANTTKEQAVRNQYEFLVQEFGGPRLYEARKGHTALLGRHAPYPVTHDAAKTWLRHMSAALEKMENEISASDRRMLLDYFRHMAAYVVVGRELLNPARSVGYFGKHREGDT